MRQVIAELCDLLGEQKGVLGEMLRLSGEERSIIVSGDAERLEGIVRLELKALSKLGAIEKKRLALHERISQELGIPGKDINVTAIALRAEPTERREIRKLQEELTKLIREHAALNMENRELINAHIEYSEMMVNLMVGSEDPLNNFYGGDGRATEEKKKTTGFFDSRA